MAHKPNPIREARQRLQLTFHELAARLDIHHVTLRRWETTFDRRQDHGPNPRAAKLRALHQLRSLDSGSKAR